jgi:lipopolysaccharide transport system permease protein
VDRQSVSIKNISGVAWDNGMQPASEIVIEPRRRFGGNWRELYAARELLLFLMWRDLLVRYKQTALGIAWAFARPAATMLVLTVIFGHLARLPSEGTAPYPLLVLCALLPWQLFAGALTDCGNSLVGNATLVAKVYFPRIIIPTSAAITSLVDFAVALLALAGLMTWYSCPPTPRMLCLPLFVLLALLLAWGAGLWVAALTVRYRDFRFLIPFALQFGLLVSPVGFSSSVVPERWRLVYALNPLVGVIDGFRWSVFGSEFPFPGVACLIALVWAGVLTIGGILFFHRVERQFADII